jgi:hypothetical protein
MAQLPIADYEEVSLMAKAVFALCGLKRSKLSYLQHSLLRTHCG